MFNVNNFYSVSISTLFLSSRQYHLYNYWI